GLPGPVVDDEHLAHRLMNGPRRVPMTGRDPRRARSNIELAVFVCHGDAFGNHAHRLVVVTGRTADRAGLAFPDADLDSVVSELPPRLLRCALLRRQRNEIR